MPEHPGYALADTVQRLVSERIGLASVDVQCPRTISPYAPCIVRKGRLAVALTSSGRALCIACQADVDDLLRDEQVGL